MLYTQNFFALSINKAIAYRSSFLFSDNKLVTDEIK